MAEDRSPAVPVEELFITAPDGVKLAATLYLPGGDSGMGDDAARGMDNGIAILLNSFMATPRQYYRAFCTHMARLGFSILTYDYRGVGGSTFDMPPVPVRTGVVWAGVDQAAAAEWLLQRFPGYTYMLVGHSYGGQMLGLAPHAGVWSAIQLVATSHGYWVKWPWPQRYRTWLRAYVQAPLLALLPRALQEKWGGAPNMPFPLSHEMAVYLRTPWFFVDEQGKPIRPYNDLIRAPLRHTMLTDDEVVPPGSDIDVALFYPNARYIPDLRTPESYGLKSVGHFGFFRRLMPTSAWDDVAQWLLAQKKP